MQDPEQARPHVRLSRRHYWLNLPNAISSVRVPLAAAFVFIESLPWRLGIVSVAAASDWLDGVLARRTGRTTRTGELLDPIADRTFMVTALVSLALSGYLPPWSLPLLLVRDIGVVVGGAVILARNPRARLRARPAGKRLTWIQFAAIGLLLLVPGLVVWVVVPVSLLGVLALLDYARNAGLVSGQP
jgi:CDP-diacylglycerol--glycerol-3-phosphate 3-phosphatidyltransferase/cardiolipin synthase